MDKRVQEIANIIEYIREKYIPIMPIREKAFFTSDFIDLDIMVNTKFKTFPEQDEEISSILGYVKDILERCKNDFGK